MFSPPSNISFYIPGLLKDIGKVEDFYRHPTSEAPPPNAPKPIELLDPLHDVFLLVNLLGWHITQVYIKNREGSYFFDLIDFLYVYTNDENYFTPKTGIEIEGDYRLAIYLSPRIEGIEEKKNYADSSANWFVEESTIRFELTEQNPGWIILTSDSDESLVHGYELKAFFLEIVDGLLKRAADDDSPNSRDFWYSDCGGLIPLIFSGSWTVMSKSPIPGLKTYFNTLTLTSLHLAYYYKQHEAILEIHRESSYRGILWGVRELFIPVLLDNESYYDTTSPHDHVGNIYGFLCDVKRGYKDVHGYSMNPALEDFLESKLGKKGSLYSEPYNILELLFVLHELFIIDCFNTRQHLIINENPPILNYSGFYSDHEYKNSYTIQVNHAGDVIEGYWQERTPDQNGIIQITQSYFLGVKEGVGRFKIRWESLSEITQSPSYSISNLPSYNTQVFIFSKSGNNWELKLPGLGLNGTQWTLDQIDSNIHLPHTVLAGIEKPLENILFLKNRYPLSFHERQTLAGIFERALVEKDEAHKAINILRLEYDAYLNHFLKIKDETDIQAGEHIEDWNLSTHFYLVKNTLKSLFNAFPEFYRNLIESLHSSLNAEKNAEEEAIDNASNHYDPEPLPPYRPDDDILALLFLLDLDFEWIMSPEAISYYTYEWKMESSEFEKSGNLGTISEKMLSRMGIFDEIVQKFPKLAKIGSVVSPLDYGFFPIKLFLRKKSTNEIPGWNGGDWVEYSGFIVDFTIPAVGIKFNFRTYPSEITTKYPWSPTDWQDQIFFSGFAGGINIGMLDFSLADLKRIFGFNSMSGWSFGRVIFPGLKKWHEEASAVSFGTEVSSGFFTELGLTLFYGEFYLDNEERNKIKAYQTDAAIFEDIEQTDIISSSFAPNVSELTPNGKLAIDHFVCKNLHTLSNSSSHLTIYGYASTTGSEESNLLLSYKRAKTVYDTIRRACNFTIPGAASNIQTANASSAGTGLLFRIPLSNINIKAFGETPAIAAGVPDNMETQEWRRVDVIINGLGRLSLTD